MTECCTKKEIAQALGVTIRTVERLEERRIIVLRATATGRKYCFKSELKKILGLYLKCRRLS